MMLSAGWEVGQGWLYAEGRRTARRPPRGVGDCCHRTLIRLGVSCDWVRVTADCAQDKMPGEMQYMRTGPP